MACSSEWTFESHSNKNQALFETCCLIRPEALLMLRSSATPTHWKLSMSIKESQALISDGPFQMIHLARIILKTFFSGKLLKHFLVNSLPEDASNQSSDPSDQLLPDDWANNLIQILEHELYPEFRQRSWTKKRKRSPYFNNILSGYWDNQFSL